MSNDTPREMSKCEGRIQSDNLPGETETPDEQSAARPSRQQPAQAQRCLVNAAASNPYIRAENEDDDGYDPYSDRREEPPLFEPDPWR